MPVNLALKPNEPCPKCGEIMWVIWNGKRICLHCDAPPIITDKQGKHYSKTSLIKELKKGGN